MQLIPNILSVSRLLLTLPVVSFIFLETQWSFLVAACLFTLAAVTDLLDGYFARSLKSFSQTGAFLDLMADKILIIYVLVALARISLVPVWLVVIIFFREALVGLLRSAASFKGKEIPARMFGKSKVFLTFFSIITILFSYGLGAVRNSLFLPFSLKGDIFEFLLHSGQLTLVVALIVTVASGIEYLRIFGSSVFSGNGKS